MNAPIEVSVVVPVYRGELVLPELVERVRLTLERAGLSWELIVVNDSDRGEAWDLIHDIAVRDPRVRGIDLMRNFGQHPALLCGIRRARGRITITIDEDLEHPPESIPVVIDELNTGFDVVYGSPSERHQDFGRRTASRFLRLILRHFFGITIAEHAGSFRAIRTSLREGFANYNSPFVSVDVLLSRTTSRFSWIAIPHSPSKLSRSSYSFRKLMIHALDLVTGFSSVPIRVASILGLFFTLFGVGTFLWAVGRYFLLGGSVPGFPFLASVISIFSGAQLFALGVIGEYIARIHFRSMMLPPYVVRRDSETDA